MTKAAPRQHALTFTEWQAAYYGRTPTCPKPVLNPVEHLVSSAMKSMVAGFNINRPHQITIFDLPPMLSSDDFLAFLPQVDCALLVASSGESTVSDITECERLVDPEKFLGCVLNKVTETETMESAEPLAPCVKVNISPARPPA